MEFPTKQCSKCKETKPIYEFWRRMSSWDGFSPQCKECASKRRGEPTHEKVRKYMPNYWGRKKKR